MMDGIGSLLLLKRFGDETKQRRCHYFPAHRISKNTTIICSKKLKNFEGEFWRRSHDQISSHGRNVVFNSYALYQIFLPVWKLWDYLFAMGVYEGRDIDTQTDVTILNLTVPESSGLGHQKESGQAGGQVSFRWCF